MDPYFRVRCPRSGCFWACFALEVAIRFEFEPRPLGRLRRFFRLSAGATVPAPVGVSLPASSCVSGATPPFADASTFCTAAATSSSAAPVLPVGRATLLSAGSGSCTGSAGRERCKTTIKVY